MNTTEDSSLHALRELRELERRRLRQEEQARSKIAQERRAREDTERQAAEARELAESSRLGRELESARSEIAHLRGELERACLAREQVGTVPPPGTNRARSAAWLGITAGATMLMGALALAAATGPSERPRSLAEIPTGLSPACPAISPPDLVEPQPPPQAVAEPIVPKNASKPRPPTVSRPHVKPSVATICDGTDPLCGIDPKVDDVGKRPRKR